METSSSRQPSRVAAAAPEKHPHLRLFAKILRGFTMLSAFILIVSNIAVIAIEASASYENACDALKTALPVYHIMFSLVIVFTECGARFVLNNAHFLEKWLLRGIFWLIVGFFNVADCDSAQEAWHVIKVVGGCMLIGSGVLYALLGFCCLQRLANAELQPSKSTGYQTQMDTV